MANYKKISTRILVLGAVVIVAVGFWASRSSNTERNAVADDNVALADFRSTDIEAIQRGEYVMRTADCAACHTQGKNNMAGGYPLATPFGTLVSSNITPDRDTGIGQMTERDFFNAVRNGQGSKGFLYPAMPYTAYANLTDQDMHDLWAYMSTVTPVNHAIDENSAMAFPYNIRLAMLGWNMLFFDNKAFDGDADGADRGRYLVDAGGHCSVCHSPRNALGAEKSDHYLQGGQLGSWYAPDITSNPHVGIGDVSVEDLAEYLGTGTNGQATAAGPMAEAVEHSLQYMSEDDLMAIASYLKSVPASKTKAHTALDASLPSMKRGALAYEVNCAACHGVEGEGMGELAPALAGNHALQGEPNNAIRALMVGARAAATHTKLTGAGMPSFAWKMNDQQIKDVLDYVRNSWGNAAQPVTPEQIERIRVGMQARDKMIDGY
ncbi:alcohol dehydrogenase [Terasakiispira papahanaumokuakeensis]|uniref:Alcohol dehydrogenase n=1 Tax=Terasakiispira papahanaumokuakeensis TaxID=197479 RepID=A0A1E2VDS6_9GAMM|nr:cytochrome c [Terasakiispira papahanaumokuakeensis]ODC04815.1 alcohol dehydrogenase [Terasakiispira papahanaumokuakeensis]